MFRSVLPLSFIIATRFFGLFIVLPVLSLYALNLKGASENLIGLVIGIYAIMQMIFQVPFGALSDRIGRKNALCLGLIVFIIGSFICAFSNDIFTMIIGRALQGSGAVGAVATALISDFIVEEKRGKAMAIMGGMIAFSFAVSMILSPILSAKFGISSLFELSAYLTIFCLILLYIIVPKEPKIKSLKQKTPFLEILKDKDLTLMNLTSFLQKMFMTMAFVIIPIVLVKDFNFDKNELYKIYGIATFFGFFAMGFSGAMGERRGLAKGILLAGILFFIVSFIIFAVSHSVLSFSVGVVIFFIGFNMHEPIMQSVASKFAKISQRGEVLGIFNSAGYFGSFIGAVSGGIIVGFHIGILAIFVAILDIIWFWLLLKLTNPNDFKNLYLDKFKVRNFGVLGSINGVVEFYETNENFVIKYNRKVISERQILEIL
ncbi:MULTISPECIES: MFS transporter [Campylobacter]|uniref:MFS transporter n=1 Tax=Campylobacter TaxID=194 RepID=UPI0023F3FBAA|nr:MULTISPECIES: MFS transporter [Campylobacter]MCI6641158.1 MFS transporter [Campylobacter sp.]MDD7421920.1 MFS transporter [Campylobacter hominis]MDY3117475.1 MFS transporter [Campylobacter hominis]